MPNRARTPELLRPVLLTSAALIIAGGIGVALILGETTIGLIIAAVGVFDLLTMRFVLRSIERRGSSSDPSYNPYARED